MKVIQLIIGAALAYFGFQDVAAEPPEPMGWVLVFIGAIVVLGSFTSSRRPSKSSDLEVDEETWEEPDENDSWGDSDGGDSGDD